jgi:hypothetical protein
MPQRRHSCRAFGSLKPSARGLLRQIALDAGARRLTLSARDRAIKPGTVLLVAGAEMALEVCAPHRIGLAGLNPPPTLASEAVAELRKRGFKAFRLEEGYPEWRAAGLPIEQSALRRLPELPAEQVQRNSGGDRQRAENRFPRPLGGRVG